MPLSFLWHDDALLIATEDGSPTARNLQSGGQVRVGVGPTRDVVLVEAAATVLDGLDEATGDAFAEKTGFDPRQLDNYTFYRVVPSEIRAWREVERARPPVADARRALAGRLITGRVPRWSPGQPARHSTSSRRGRPISAS